MTRDPLEAAPIGYVDLRRMWGFRTWLLAAQLLVQGGQYVVAPSRPLHLSTYRLLTPLGVAGWEVIGVLYVLAAVGLALVKARRIPTPTWTWTLAFSIAGTLVGFLFIATLLNHGYLPSTLILPLGLCLAELDLIGRVRVRRDPRGDAECG